MCGFLGYASKSPIPNLDKLLLKVNQISHRGPDSKGSWTSNDKSVGFSHQRLSIVDLSENGDIKEALFNIYDVLHQLNNIDKPNILFMDLYNSKTDLYKTMTDKLTRCCNNRRIMIPLHYD